MRKYRRFVVYTCSVVDGPGYSFEVAASAKEANANAVAMGYLLFLNLERAKDRVFVKDTVSGKLTEFKFGAGNTFEECAMEAPEFRDLG